MPTTTDTSVTTSTTEPRLMTPMEVAEWCSYSLRTIRRWTSEGLLPYVGPRRRPRYSLRDVERALRVLADGDKTAFR
jgi:excisionase family DNA binding protein